MTPRLLSFLRAAWRRAAFERDMDEEMRFHLDARVSDPLRRGHPEAAAVRIAQREFGNAALHRDRCRDARWLTLLDDLQEVLKYE